MDHAGASGGGDESSASPNICATRASISAVVIDPARPMERVCSGESANEEEEAVELESVLTIRWILSSEKLDSIDSCAGGSHLVGGCA